MSLADRLRAFGRWLIFHAISEPYRIRPEERQERMASMELYSTSRRQVRQLPTTEKGTRR